MVSSRLPDGRTRELLSVVEREQPQAARLRMAEHSVQFVPNRAGNVSCEVRTAHTVYLCVPYGSHSNQRLFPHTALTDLAL
jgi:hypothetical protein